MNKHEQLGYFHITISSGTPRLLFSSNNERAFVVSFLQRTLSMRTILEGPLGHQSLAAQIDLLAFSLIRSSCELVLFGISTQSVDILCRRLCNELQDYSHSYGKAAFQIVIKVSRLSGPHDALHHSTLLHARHDDWEYDRYSSIGFYLHDRRGDWMRLWRIAMLYNCDTQKYRKLLQVTKNGQYRQEIEASLQIINA